MARLGLSERVQIASVRARGLRRTTLARVLGASARTWTLSGTLKPLVVIPQDLRPTDPSFWSELESGHFGLSGAVVFLDGRSPFEVSPTNDLWLRDLHGFSWLRHLAACENASAAGVARGYVLGWLRGEGQALQRSVGAQPAVRARRVMSWIAHAPFILDGASATEFDTFLRGLTREVSQLAARRRDAAQGYDRLLVLTALVLAELATEGPERRLYAAASRLDAEIERQILPDGGHISRNPAVLIELLLDWLPLRACFGARGDANHETVAVAIVRMLALLRFIRLGDGGVARFNGMTVGDPAGLATLLGSDDRPAPKWTVAPQSRYARLNQGTTTVLADTGSPAPLMYSHAAHAGCLSMEVSAGTCLLFVNAGAPGPSDEGWRAAARATASHSTLVAGEQSSSQLVRHAGLEAMLGAVPLQQPANVTARVDASDDGLQLEASHDGYLERLGIIHRREIALSADGNRLAGTDRLETRGDRLKRDVPFAIHFHLHPDATCTPMPDGGSHLIRLADGQHWQFTASGTGGMVSTGLEESTYFAGSLGPRHSLQLVVRGATGGESSASWVVTRVDRSIMPASSQVDPLHCPSPGTGEGGRRPDEGL